jgi:hypothetical protein
VDVAILTAAWSLPRERGRWHLSRLVRAAVQCSELRGCRAVIAFVARSNPGAAILKYLGAATVPTFYLRAPAGAKIDCAQPPAIEPCAPPPHVASAADAVRFHYSTDDEWRAQFLKRPYPTRTLRIGAALAVIEEAENADRLQFLADGVNPLAAVAALAKSAHERQRDLFHFTTSKPLAAAAEKSGLGIVPGYVTIMRPARSTIGSALAAAWDVQPGDRM